jgi:recombination protein RecA
MSPKKKPVAGSKDLQAVLSELRGKEDIAIGSFAEFSNTTDPKGLSTGNLTLDSLTGISGFPRGRITELLGPPSSGKTTAALQCAGRAQQAGGTVLFADFERSLDKDYCKALGLEVDAPTFIYMQPEHFEQGANAVRRLMTTGEVDLVIHDSVAAMTTKHELEADTGAVQVADRAKTMYQYLRQLLPLMSDTNTGVIFLNHLLEKVDATPMGRQMAARGIKQWTSPGGNGLRYYASLRMEFKQIGNMRTAEMDVLSNSEVDVIRQTKTQVTVVKNKVADPFRTAELRVRFGKGFSQPFSVFSILTAYGTVKKSGSWISFPPDLRLNGDDDNAKMQGEETVLQAMEDHPEWMAVLEKAATDIIGVSGDQIYEIDAEALQAEAQRGSEEIDALLEGGTDG